MARHYLARIGGVDTWVGAGDAIDVGSVDGTDDDGPLVQWLGPLTWDQIAIDSRQLVTRGQSGELLAVGLAEDDDAPLSSHEARLIVRTLEETGQGELARRIEPILDRCTKTDPPAAEPIDVDAKRV